MKIHLIFWTDLVQSKNEDEVLEIWKRLLPLKIVESIN